MRRQHSQKREGVITRQQGSKFSTRTPGFPTSSDRERENKFYLPSLSRVFNVHRCCSLAYFHDPRHFHDPTSTLCLNLKKKLYQNAEKSEQKMTFADKILHLLWEQEPQPPAIFNVRPFIA